MYCMFTTGNSTLLPGMAAQPQPVRYKGRGRSPPAAATRIHFSLHICLEAPKSHVAHLLESTEIYLDFLFEFRNYV